MKANNQYGKNYALCFFGFGCPFILIYLVFGAGLVNAVIEGVLCGFLFATVMTVFVAWQTKRMGPVRERLLQSHNIIYEGGANHKVGRESVGGYMFLTEEGLYYVSHKYNRNNHSYSVPYERIEDVSMSKKINTIKVMLTDGSTEEFVVNNRKQWVDILKKHSIA